MDQDRQIRFLIPPIIFILSLLWGAYLCDKNVFSLLESEFGKNIIGLFAAGLITVIGIGYIIGTISTNLLRLIFFIIDEPTYEADLPTETLTRIWVKLNTNLAKEPKHILYAAATYDHELLPESIHKWIVRRWNSFNISIHSIVALFLSHIIAFRFSFVQNREWLITDLILAILFLISAICSWRETMGMINFQSYRKN